MRENKNRRNKGVGLFVSSSIGFNTRVLIGFGYIAVLYQQLVPLNFDFELFLLFFFYCTTLLFGQRPRRGR